MKISVASAASISKYHQQRRKKSNNGGIMARWLKRRCAIISRYHKHHSK